PTTTESRRLRRPERPIPSSACFVPGTAQRRGARSTFLRDSLGEPCMRHLILGCATAFVSAVAHDAGAQIAQSGTQTAAVAKALDSLRAATRRFHNLDSAVAAGYTRDVPDCLVHEQHGAMGYLHLNRALSDAKVETTRPEILLYERMPDGAYRLNGVE